jgi:hypothetical protein
MKQLSEGATLNPGDIIAVMRLDRPDKVVKAEEYKGTLKASAALKASRKYFVCREVVSY